jgi:peptide deformylase
MKLTRRVLHNPAKDVDFEYPLRNDMLVREMAALMVREYGIGLSATQVGISRRLFVMSVDGKYRECFNPKITESSETLVEFDEGCLSFPGDRCIIKRPDWVKVEYQNSSGQKTQDHLVGLEARCFQHELDHLDGITMWDRYKEQHAEQSRN